MPLLSGCVAWCNATGINYVLGIRKDDLDTFVFRKGEDDGGQFSF